MTSIKYTDEKDWETCRIISVTDSTDESCHTSYQDMGPGCTRNVSDDEAEDWRNREKDGKEEEEKEEEEEGKEEEEDEEEDGEVSFLNLPRKSKILLLLCSVANFACCLSYAVPSPFYPKEAEEKGVSVEMIGFFFSLYEIVIFMTSPVFGLHMAKLGPRFLQLSGIFLAGGGSIIFGFLGQAPSGDDFLTLTLVNRALIAVGYSAFVTSMQVTMLNEIPGNEGLLFSLMEGSAGAGFMVGPAVGGVLFEIGGFGLPFYVIGAVVSICGGVLFFILPPIQAEEQKKGQPSVFRLLLSPLAWISLMCVMVCSIGMGFLDPTLAKHLDPFNLSTGVVGLFFFINSLVYCIFTPVWGWMSDSKKIGLGPLLIIGVTMTGIAFLIIGPSAWLGFLPFEVWTITMGIVLLGMNQPSGLITTIKTLMTAAIECGLDDNVDTYGMVVGLYNFAYSAGAAAGPLLAGFLVEYYSFDTGATVVGSANFAVASVCLVYFLIHSKTRKKKSCKYKLLQENQDDLHNDQHYHNKVGSSDSKPPRKNIITYDEGAPSLTPDTTSSDISYSSFTDTFKGEDQEEADSIQRTPSPSAITPKSKITDTLSQSLQYNTDEMKSNSTYSNPHEISKNRNVSTHPDSSPCIDKKQNIPSSISERKQSFSALLSSQSSDKEYPSINPSDAMLSTSTISGVARH